MIMTMTTKLGKSMKTNISLPRTTNPNTAAARFRTACAAKLLLLLLLALPVAVQAQFTYTTNNDGTLNVSGYTGGGAVTISNSVNGLLVTSIGNNAFIDHSGLTSVTIGTNVTSIGWNVFYDCTSLTNATIPASVTSIGGCAFGWCPSLIAITVDPSNSAYSSVAGVLFNKSTTTLIECPGGKVGSYTISNSVTSIGSWAFFDCTSLTNVTIPNSVTSIGLQAFDNCTHLTSVTIPSSVTSIGIYAFQDCSSLTSVYFQGNAPSADSSVFYEDNAIVYYLPWTTGWDAATFGGLSTAVGSQQLQAGGAGVRTNQFGFTFTGTNSQVIVEACTNLSTRVWSPVGTNTLTGGSSYFSDPHWTKYPGRFYRLRAP